MISYSIYIVDDEKEIARGLEIYLSKDYAIKTLFTGGTALEAIKKEQPDLVLLDVGLPDINGIDVLREIKKDFPEVVVIMITAFEKVDTVISAMKIGAYDYVIKPVNMGSIENTICNAFESIRLKKEVKALQEKYLKEKIPCFVGESKAIADVMEFVESVAKSPDTPILIAGESGTGKELIAGAIHYRSPNFKGPLVTVNCAAIPKDLIESELFGYEGGAFSGANKSGKKGLVEQADNGTLFLDEIGDLSFEAQAKLLRFLETGEFYRVGGTKKQSIKTRLVSATNKDLKAMIGKGTFREDLFFRIAVINIQVPSLSKRREDIIPIAKYFLVQFGKKFGKCFSGISDDAQHALVSYGWSGNIRELKNVIELAALTAKGEDIQIGDLSGADKLTATEQSGNVTLPAIGPEGLDLESLLESIEKKYIQESMQMMRGNETRAAKLLYLKPTTFRYRRQKLQIAPG